MTDATFTIVTPNYNMRGYLAETIESVLRNLRQGDEYFVIDGGSTDGSVEIIRSYEDKLAGWVSEPDRGYADAIAKGFASGRGEFMGWINCGDLLLDGCLETAALELLTPEADLIFGDDLYVDETGKVIQYSCGHVDNLRDAMLYGGWTPLQDACFWRAELYDRIGGIDTSLSLAADYDLFAKMSVAGRVRHVPLVMSAFRRHAGQNSRAFSAAYEQERTRARLAAIASCGDSLPARIAKRLWYFAAIRWRVYIQQRRWAVPGIVGCDVGDFRCGPCRQNQGEQ